MQVVVYGAGAIGSLVGARLHEQGANVRLIARPAHAAAIQEHGLRLEEVHETRIVRLLARPALEGGADIILLTVKSQDVTAACRDITDHLLRPTIVTMQNGVRADEDAASVLGRDRIVGCVVQVSASYLSPGVVQAEGWGGRLLIGAPFLESRGRVPEVRDLLAPAIPTLIVPDIGRSRWTKLLMNLPNVIPAASGLPFARAFRDRRLVRIAVAAIREGTNIATATGHALDNGPYARRFRLLVAVPLPIAALFATRGFARQFSPESTFGGSTQQSLQRGSSSELDYLNGEIVRAARQIGRATPVNSALLEIGKQVFETRQTVSVEELVRAVRI
jgi:2-dehydropantoate 2-reductase